MDEVVSLPFPLLLRLGEAGGLVVVGLDVIMEGRTAAGDF